MPRLLALAAAATALAASANAALFSGSSSSDSLADRLNLKELPYVGDALKSLYDSESLAMVPKKLQQYSSKTSEALKSIQEDAKIPQEIKDAAKEAFKTGSLDKVTELLSANSLASDETVQKAKETLEEYGVPYTNYVEAFWGLSPTSGGGEPSGKLGDALKKQYGGFEQFKKKFTADVGRLWGSGWVWLVSDKSGGLSIETSRFQSRPAASKKVVLSLYLWERVLESAAFNNDRESYVNAWLKYVDWSVAGKRYEEREEKQEL